MYLKFASESIIILVKMLQINKIKTNFAIAVAEKIISMFEYDIN